MEIHYKIKNWPDPGTLSKGSNHYKIITPDIQKYHFFIK